MKENEQDTPDEGIDKYQDNEKEPYPTQKLLKSISETTSDLLFRLNKEGIIEYISPKVKTYFGYETYDLIGKHFSFTTPSSDHSIAEDAFNIVIGGGSIRNFEINQKRADGSICSMEMNADAEIVNGQVTGAQGIMRDITKRKHAEELLIKERNQAQQYLDIAGVMIGVIDINGNILKINKRGCEILEYEETEIIGLNWIENFITKNEEKEINEILNKILSGEIEPFEYHKNNILTKNGKIKTIAFHNSLITDDHSKITGVLFSGEDITDLENAKLKAEESDKLKSAFLTNLSHEIRTPLNGIVGFSQLLNEPDISAEKRTQYAMVINESGKQLLNIINDIIDISKIESGQIDVNMSKVSINEKLYETYGFFKPILSKKEIELILIKGLIDADSIVYTDGTKLQQIINNLISNAIKFTSQGYIEYGYYLREDFIEFYVKDTGIGVTTEFQEKIFDRFSQEDTNWSQEHGGTGLGLSITKAYVELLGGKIWLKSKPGLGTTFYFTVPYKPATKKVQEIIKDAGETTIDLTGNTLLIAEDNDMNFMLLEELLVKSKAKIIRAKNGQEAVDLCKKLSSIDMVLMDIKMPIMNGYEATQEIKSFKPDLPIIAQSAFAMIEDERKALDAGADDYVSKPIKKSLLISKIGKLLNK